VRHRVAALLERLPWVCEGFLAAWEALGGWSLLRKALDPRWRRVCMADAARNETCYCGRYAVLKTWRYVYRATRVEWVAGIKEKCSEGEGAG